MVHLAFSPSLPVLARHLLPSASVRAASFATRTYTRPSRDVPRAAIRVHTSPESESAVSKHQPKDPSPRRRREVKPQTSYASPDYAVAVLKGAKAHLFRNDGSCLVFAGAVDRVTPRIGTDGVTAAEAVCVVDGVGRKVGYGVYNSTDSMFAVRILKHVGNEKEVTFDVGESVKLRVRRAFSVRKSFGLPCSGTDVFRAVNSEGDRLSGLAVDIFGSTAVVVSSAVWCERYRESIVEAVEEAMVGVVGVDKADVKTVWRMSADRLRQDGSDKITDADAKLIPSLAPFRKSRAEIENEVTVAKPAPDEADDIVVSENGIEYVLPAAALRSGQKTGFYADQSDNRLGLRAIIARRPGASVLDCYCYSGGFGISAALGGAAAVTAVDSSAPSLEMARVNAARNGVDERMSFVQSEVSIYLDEAADRGEKWDCVVLDPPKLAPSAKTASLDRATRKYQSINCAALKLVAPGGLLLTCSCSQAMTKDRDVFLAMVRKAAYYAGREITLLQTSGAAPDHPTDLSEGANAGYLTACLFSVS